LGRATTSAGKALTTTGVKLATVAKGLPLLITFLALAWLLGGMFEKL
jgi:hypothetical protein